MAGRTSSFRAVDIAEALVSVLDAAELIAFDTPSRVVASDDPRVRVPIDTLPPFRELYGR